MSDEAPRGAQEAATHLTESATIQVATASNCAQAIAEAATSITDAFRNGHRLYICGNGGSAADAQHMAAELITAGLPATALTTDTSIITAIANDYGYEYVFSRQLRALAKPGDVLLVISTSGKSLNILRAANEAYHQGLTVIALTGRRGISHTWSDDPDPPRQLAILVLSATSTNVAYIQETHLAIEHTICELVVKALRREP